MELSLCCFDLTENEFYCSHLIQVYITPTEFDTRAFKDSTHDKCGYWTLKSAATPFYPWAKGYYQGETGNFLCVTDFPKVKIGFGQFPWVHEKEQKKYPWQFPR